MRTRNLFAHLLVVLCLANVVVWAQSSTTSLRGTVTDASGAAVAAAKVTLTSPDRGIERTTTTGAVGGYEFLQLLPGTYQLTVEMAGFRKFEQKGIQLLINTPSTTNVTLAVGATSETVEVTGEAAQVNTTDASLGIAFSEGQIKSLPLEARNVAELLSLQAGVAYTGNNPQINEDIDTRKGAVNGARSDQSNITLDGVSVNDQLGKAFKSVLPVSLDSVQEFRVTTTNYNADQGGSSGAQVALVTKSGTNKFHGSLYEYHRNTITSANDYFVKTAQLLSGQPNKAPQLIRNIFGASVGGPIMKDRLYFFANYEGYRQREQNSVLRIVPSDSLRQGIIRYACDATDPNCAPGNPTGAQVAVDPIVGVNVASLTPVQILGMDPLHLGDNSIMLNYFKGFPEPNDLTQGDQLNFVGYRFRGPVRTNQDWYIARLDYKLTQSGNHSLFWSGSVRNDRIADTPYLPGTDPLRTLVNYSK